MASHLTIPPKMLTKMAVTLGSLVISSKAALIACGVAPPPTSRKLAGLPPLSLIMSMVAIARPAPLTLGAVSKESSSQRLNCWLTQTPNISVQFNEVQSRSRTHSLSASKLIENEIWGNELRSLDLIRVFLGSISP